MDKGTIMPAIVRLVLQMTANEKRSLDRRARRAGVSTAEFVRRRIGPDDLDDRREEIKALATLEHSASRILRALDGAIETAGEVQAAIDQARSGS
jgi:hypothetical protein